ncbi:MAG: polysaccharide deacetylase family protein [Clostridia bacterium]|nr:polysaccharide deacetylase family protein [Clostridia bacterium]
MSKDKKYAVFTMDVEDFSDTGCIARRGLSPEDDMFDGLDKYVELLERHGIRATLFTLASTARKIEDRLASFARRGHKIALHGLDHTSLERLSDEEFREGTRAAREYLEGVIGERVLGYRAPFFSMDDEKIGILQEMGFSYDSSSQAFEKNYLRGAFNMEEFERVSSCAGKRQGFFEFSLPCENILGCNYPVSGGGYDRICPWPLVKNGIKRYIKKNDMYVFYLHPFELSDNRCESLRRLPKNERLYLNYGISSYAKKIERIIEMLEKEGYTFITFEELCEILESEKQKELL